MSRSRRLLSVLAVSSLLGLAACGGESTAEPDGPDAGSDVTFTGDPVTILSMAPYDNPILDRKEILEVVEAAVKKVNADGGINGSELKLVTCNEGFDPNMAADCAREAVNRDVAAVVGGFAGNGDVILPILEEAGIPWLGTPLISAGELTSAVSFPLSAGAAGLAGLGLQAAKDGCKTVAAPSTETGTASTGLGLLIGAGAQAGGVKEVETIRMPPNVSDYSGIAQQAQGVDCVVMAAAGNVIAGFAAANASLGGTTKMYVMGASISQDILDAAGPVLEGIRTWSTFPVAEDPIWDDAKAAAPSVTDGGEAGWVSLINQNAWVSVVSFANFAASLDEVSSQSVLAGLQAETAFDTLGFTEPIDFTKSFFIPDFARAFNMKAQWVTVEDGKLVPDSDEISDLGEAFASMGQ
ncbi:ABC transporter substrate-binding protein [Nocardioides massiliensis]|uniref:ABC-type branched-subunit amino acid transport system substrate-binding protein n=2 Tax=Nocardioides massiliensis TaxID=1325935 RepID=A0ABT9NJ53_9ACTN|nr:ABC transporter substrate-binding protein [Nocardioides massiliensis]MDP9820448.1 ABC-type branched-subunit amino acid transport system substrate-binding protein [Nocardioides massiliensis]